MIYYSAFLKLIFFDLIICANPYECAIKDYLYVNFKMIMFIGIVMEYRVNGICHKITNCETR